MEQKCKTRNVNCGNTNRRLESRQDEGSERRPKMGPAYVSAISTFVDIRISVNAPKTPCIQATPSLCTRYNIRLHCDSTIIGTGRPSARHSNLRVRRAMAANDPGMREGRTILNSNQIYRAVRTFVLIRDAAPTNCSYVLRHLHRVLTLARC